MKKWDVTVGFYIDLTVEAEDALGAELEAIHTVETMNHIEVALGDPEVTYMEELKEEKHDTH
jgi:hypothetical protein